MKAFFAFLIGLAALFLIYYFLSFPVLPCVCIYLTALLFASGDKHMLPRMIFTILITIISACFYILNTSIMITHYPQYGNVFGIIFEIITILAIIGSGIFWIISFVADLKQIHQSSIKNF